MSNIVQKVLESASNPIPEGRLDDILRPGADNPLQQHGFVEGEIDDVFALHGEYGLAVAGGIGLALRHGIEGGQGHQGQGGG